MPAPTNTTAATATLVGTISDTATTITQRVDDAGTTYTVWFSFVAPSNRVVISAFGYGDASVYTPTTTPWSGPASAPVNILSISGGANLGIQFPVTAGTTYFLKVVPNGGNPTPANLTLTVKSAATDTAPIGSIGVNDDTSGFPLALLSGTSDYVVQQFLPLMPAGEAGDTLASGTLLLENSLGNTLDLYTVAAGAFVLGPQVATGISAPRIRTCNAVNKFYAGESSNPAIYYTVSSAGVKSASVTLTANTSLGALASNNAETVLYFAQTPAGEAVKTWNIPGNAAGADFVAGIALYQVTDILVLGDTSVVVGYKRGSTDFKVLRYSAAGATLNTYTFGSSFTSTGSRLAYAIDDPTSFWVWTHPASTNTGTSKFLNIKASDGSVLSTRLQFEYEDGVQVSAATATPAASVGPSFSCPFWIQRAQIGLSPTTTTSTIRRQRRCLLPSSPDNKNMQIPTLELLMRTGIGLTPGAASDPSVLGSDPTVMMRLSKDGGQTYLPEQGRSAGRQGRYKDRVRWLRATGNYRNAVLELTVSDPVDWQWIAVLGDPQEGTS